MTSVASQRVVLRDNDWSMFTEFVAHLQPLNSYSNLPVTFSVNWKFVMPEFNIVRRVGILRLSGSASPKTNADILIEAE